MTDMVPPSLVDKNEEDLYEMAYAEVHGETRRQGLWAKSLSNTLGDEQKATALYIQLRFDQLIQDRRLQLLDNMFPFQCPQCGKTRAVSGRQIAECYEDDWSDFECPHCNHLDDIRDILPNSTIQAFSTINDERLKPALTAIPGIYPENEWSSGAMIGLVIGTILIPLIGIILGLSNNSASPTKKKQAKILFIIGCTVFAIHLILFFISQVITQTVLSQL